MTDSPNNDDPMISITQRVTALEVKVGSMELDLREMKEDIKEVRRSLNRWLWFGFSTTIGVLINLILWILMARGVI